MSLTLNRLPEKKNKNKSSSIKETYKLFFSLQLQTMILNKFNTYEESAKYNNIIMIDFINYQYNNYTNFQLFDTLTRKQNNGYNSCM